MSKAAWFISTGSIVLILAIIAVRSYMNGYNHMSYVINKENREVGNQIIVLDNKPNSDAIAAGKELHLKILNSHKKLDSFYKEPIIFGGLSPNPQCCISIPITDWNTLSESEKNSIKKYVASLISTVKSDPYKYANIDSNAPIATTIKNNVSKMNDDSWNITLGNITSDGKDISSDKYIK